MVCGRRRIGPGIQRIMSIERSDNALLILETLKKVPKGSSDNAYISGREIQNRTNLSSDDINEAIELLERMGLVSCQRTRGTKPFDCGKIQASTRGRRQIQ